MESLKMASETTKTSTITTTPTTTPMNNSNPIELFESNLLTDSAGNNTNDQKVANELSKRQKNELNKERQQSKAIQRESIRNKKA